MSANALSTGNLSLSQFLTTKANSQAPALLLSEVTLTHQQLIEVVYGCAETLRLSPVQQWALACEHCQDFTIGLFALCVAGKDVCLPANSQPGTLSDISQHAPSLLTAECGTGFAGDIVNLKALMADCSATSSFDSVEPLTYDPALVFFTSGSSGQPKAIPKRLGQLVAEVNALELLWGDGLGSATVLACVAHQHIYGVLFRILWPLLAGRTVQTEQFEYPENLLAHIQTLPSAYVVASPAQMDRLPLDLDWQSCRDKVAAVFSSGAPLSLKGAEAGQRCFGVTPCEVFGSTESGGVAWRQQSRLENTSHWMPLPGVQTTLSDGLLGVHSPWNGLPCGEGLIMGDKAQCLDDGRFVLLGRADTIVKVEGKRVSLTEIANRLQTTEWVERAEIVLLDGHRQQLGAVVVLTNAGQAQLSDHGRLVVSRLLRSELLQHFEAITLPRKWRFLEAFPVNSQGKLVRSAFVPLFAQNERKPEISEV